MIILPLIFLLTSCEYSDEWKEPKIDEIPKCYNAYKEHFQGHVYIIFYGWREKCVLHDPDCPCKNRKEV